MKTFLAAASRMEGVSMTGFFSGGCCPYKGVAPAVHNATTVKTAKLLMPHIL
jgi:hypothetical protein